MIPDMVDARTFARIMQVPSKAAADVSGNEISCRLTPILPGQSPL
jgi:hypothetical protein